MNSNIDEIEISLLKNIRSKADSLRSLLSQYSTTTTTCLTAPSIPPLNLPHPTQGSIDLRSHNLPPKIETAIATAVSTWTQRLHQQHSTSYYETCQKLISSSPTAAHTHLERTRALFQKSYETQRLRGIQEQVLRAVSSYAGAGPGGKRKKPFNSDYVPLLEKYFEYNAYPSAFDRKTLAQKTMMEPRQIEVWFQNHRNRAKKEGRYLRRLSRDPLPVELDLRSLESTMPSLVFKSSERKNCTSGEMPNVVKPQPQVQASFTTFPQYHPMKTCQATPHRDESVLNPPAPPHAFPTTYPPPSDYHPFPSEISVISFPAPCWTRMPSLKPSVKQPSITVDQLTQKLSSLNIRSSARMPSKSTRASIITCFSTTTPWTLFNRRPSQMQRSFSCESSLPTRSSFIAPRLIIQPVHLEQAQRVRWPTPESLPSFVYEPKRTCRSATLGKRHPSAFSPYLRARSIRRSASSTESSDDNYSSTSSDTSSSPTTPASSPTLSFSKALLPGSQYGDVWNMNSSPLTHHYQSGVALIQ